MNKITRTHRTPIMHRAVRYGNMVYVGGLAANDFTQPMEIQTAQALEKLEAILAEHGSDRNKVLSTTVFITDMSLKPKMNEAWTAFFGDELPTRATIGVANLEPGVLIEFTSIAVVG